jgi:hypothetical protein
MIIYVLAPDTSSLEQAMERYTDPIFKPIILPQTPYLESYMYTDYLMEHHDEWKDHDWVGCIAHSAWKKQPSIHKIGEMMTEASNQSCDVCAFLYRGDPLVATAETWHPGFSEAWKKLWNSDLSVTMDHHIRSFYCNYWATRPSKMEEYCRVVRGLKTRIDNEPDLKDSLWKDSSYGSRGSEIAKISPEKCISLWGVPYYPLLPFVFERLPCFYFSVCSRSKFAFIY